MQPTESSVKRMDPARDFLAYPLERYVLVSVPGAARQAGFSASNPTLRALSQYQSSQGGVP
ncbi:MAG: hypothetical protein WHS46_03160 [Desulfosoma sp.]